MNSVSLWCKFVSRHLARCLHCSSDLDISNLLHWRLALSPANSECSLSLSGPWCKAVYSPHSALEESKFQRESQAEWPEPVPVVLIFCLPSCPHPIFVSFSLFPKLKILLWLQLVFIFIFAFKLERSLLLPSPLPGPTIAPSVNWSHSHLGHLVLPAPSCSGLRVQLGSHGHWSGIYMPFFAPPSWVPCTCPS